MKNVKSFEEYVNEAYNNLFQETLTPKEAIDKATQEINHARKLDNPGLVDKITGQLKSWLDSIKYDWKKDAAAMELLGDYVSEGFKNIFKSDVVDFTKEEKPKPQKRNKKYDWAKTKEDIAKSEEEEEEEEEVVSKYTKPSEPDIRSYQDRRGQTKFRDISRYKKVMTKR